MTCPCVQKSRGLKSFPQKICLPKVAVATGSVVEFRLGVAVVKILSEYKKDEGHHSHLNSLTVGASWKFQFSAKCKGVLTTGV